MPVLRARSVVVGTTTFLGSTPLETTTGLTSMTSSITASLNIRRTRL
jgi:hypothetical protein